MAENLPLITAGTYSGLPTENPSDFIDRYLIAAQSNNWSEATKLNLFPAHLADTALAWYKHYKNGGEVNRWDDLKTKFIEIFTPVAQAHNLQAVLENKVQDENQPPLNYFLEIVTLCRRYDPTIADRKIIEYIIQGLRPELCERIVMETNDTLNQLEYNINRVEKQLLVKNRNKEKYVRATAQEKRERYDKRNNRDDLREIQTDIKTLTNIVANLSVKDGRNEDRRKDDRPRSPYWNRRYEGTTNSSPRSPGRYRSYGDGRGRERTPERRERTPERRERTPDRRTATHGRTGDWSRSRDDYQRRDYRTPHRSQDRRVTFAGGQGRGWQQERRRFCRICNRNNHDTSECRFRTQGQGYNGYKERKYCDHCRMNNHNRQDCYKLKRASQKNV